MREALQTEPSYSPAEACGAPSSPGMGGPKAPPQVTWEDRLRAVAASGGVISFIMVISCDAMTLQPMLRVLGAPMHVVTAGWFLAAFSGLVVSPIFCHYSDVCTHRWGRRRPFVFYGMGTACVLMCLAPYSGRVGGEVLGYPLLMLMIWLIISCCNASEGAVRALPLEVSPRHMSTGVNAMMGAGCGLTLLMNGAIVSHNWKNTFPFLYDMLPEQTASLGAPIFVSTFFSALFVAASVSVKEKRLGEGDGVEERQHFKPPGATGGGFSAAWASFRGEVSEWWATVLDAPPPLRRVCWVTFFAWGSGAIRATFNALYVAELVYHGRGDADPGTPERERFDEGARVVGLMTTVTGSLQWIPLAFMPWILRRIRLGHFYAAFLFVLAAGPILQRMTLDEKSLCSFIVVCSANLGFSVRMALPFEYISRMGRPKTFATDCGTFNMMNCAGQVSAILISMVMQACGADLFLLYDFSAVLAFAGFLVALTLPELPPASHATPEDEANLLAGSEEGGYGAAPTGTSA